MEMIKCIECGAEFSKKGKKIYCNIKCQQKAGKRRNKNNKIRTIKEKKFQNEISRINSLALKENLTYGKYVAKYGI